MSPKPIIAAGGESLHADGVSFALREWAHGPMPGPPLHVHHSDDEAWHVLEGTLRFRFADGTAEAPAGTTVFVPAGVAHTFGSDDDVRYLIMSTERVFALIEALHTLDDPSPDELAEAYRRHDTDIVEA